MEHGRTVELSADEWSRALVEELLFRAAAAVSDAPPKEGFVEIALTFRLTPNAVDGSIEIRADRAAEASLVTRLRRPF